MNKQNYFLIPFVLFLILANFLLFYYIIGSSVLIYFGIFLFIILIIFGVYYYYYYQRKVNPYPKLIIKQGYPLEQESLIQNLQNKAFCTIEKTNFIFHKKILIIELIIIVILFLNLILRVWQKE